MIFNVECDSSIFSKIELDYLKKNGKWLERFARGQFAYKRGQFTDKPSPEQRSFFRVFQRKTHPQLFPEKIWFRYITRIKWEKGKTKKNWEDYLRYQKSNWIKLIASEPKVPRIKGDLKLTANQKKIPIHKVTKSDNPQSNINNICIFITF